MSLTEEVLSPEYLEKVRKEGYLVEPGVYHMPGNIHVKLHHTNTEGIRKCKYAGKCQNQKDIPLCNINGGFAVDVDMRERFYKPLKTQFLYIYYIVQYWFGVFLLNFLVCYFQLFLLMLYFLCNYLNREFYFLFQLNQSLSVQIDIFL